jgi:hypothetical protein
MFSRRSLLERLEDKIFQDGSFTIFVSSDPGFLKSSESCTSPFFEALTLAALTEARDELAGPLKNRLSLSLKKEEHENGSFMYWHRGSAETKQRPYPDDLDTTSVCLSALRKYDSAFFSGERLGKYVNLLLAQELKPGGPYKTWLVDEAAGEAWKDIDPVVNANIAAFLLTEEIALKGLSAYLADMLADRAAVSPYYLSRIPFLYFLSHGGEQFFSGIREEIVKIDSSSLTPLELSMLITTLCRIGSLDLARAHASSLLLLSVEEIDQPYPFCIDRKENGQAFFAGSPVLTLSLTLEATALLGRLQASAEREEKGEEAEALFAAVLTRAKNRFTSCPPDLQRNAYEVISQMAESDTRREKTLLPYFYAKGTGGLEGVEKEWLETLCLAHFFGWIAYTIYDHVLDDELIKSHLPVANVALRELTLLFSRFVPPGVLMDILDAVEGANTWEVTHCRLPVTVLPDFTRGKEIVERSWGLILSPLAICLKFEFALESKETMALKTFFEHYIFAKQLNDDAHDWEADLLCGQLNPVNTRVLERFPEALANAGVHLERLRSIFWNTVLPGICQDIFSHIQKAEESILLLPLGSRDFLSALLKPFEQSAHDALAERDRTLAFLESVRFTS